MDEYEKLLNNQLPEVRNAIERIVFVAGTSDADWQVLKSGGELLSDATSKLIDARLMLHRFIGMAQERTWPSVETINEARTLLGIAYHDKPAIEEGHQQAADRLAELKELNELWEAQTNTANALVDAVKRERDEALQENERLRGALEVYADEKNWHCTEFGEYHEHSEKCCKDGWWTRSENGYDIAREALQENHDGCG